MWLTNLKLVVLVLVVLGAYTFVANSIPQIESEVPTAVALGADATPEQLAAAGERIYQGAGGCTTCHGLGTRAPNLLTDEGGAGTIGARCGNREPGKSCKQYLFEALTNPGGFVVPGYQPIMPDMRRTLPGDQVWAVVAYLQSLGGTIDVTAEDLASAREGGGSGAAAPPAQPPGAPATVSLNAREIINANGCLGCHRLGGEGGTIAPPFDGIGARLTRDQLRQGILEPNATVAAGFESMRGTMPATFGQTMTAAQLEALVGFLANRK
jgi:ubiquinol-cytochrome c reductase cytochrome b subunit